MRALVLSGGGSYGAFQAGVISELLEGYDAYCGVSVGAINAVWLAQHTDWDEARATLQSLWRNISTDQVYKHHFPLGPIHALWRTSFYDTQPLRNFLAKYLSESSIQASGKLLRIGSVSMTDGKFKSFTEKDTGILDALMASSAMPMFFSLPHVRGDVWVDGGIRNQTPLKAAFDLGATEIDIVLSTPLDTSPKWPAPSNVIDVGQTVIQIMLDEIFKTDLTCAELYNCMARRDDPEAKGKRDVPIRVFEPPGPWEGSPLDFHPDKVRHMLKVGREVATACQ